MQFSRIVALAFTCLAFTAPAFSETGPMSGADIKRDIIGKRIFLAAPLGGELPLNYRRNGRVDGSGEAVGLGRMLAPSDSGRWWIKGNALCQKWQEWYDGRQFCFTITKLSSSSIRWQRDDGESGLARIGS